MAIAVGLDVHRAQITFDALDLGTGEVQTGRIAPASRVHLRRFLRRWRGAELIAAVEATTGWRFVVEELRRVGAEVHLAEPAETSARRGNKRRAKTDRRDARHLRELLVERRIPEAWIPPDHILDLRSLERLRKTLVDARTEWLQRIHAVLLHHGVKVTGRLDGRDAADVLAKLDLLASAQRQIAVALSMVAHLNHQLTEGGRPPSRPPPGGGLGGGPAKPALVVDAGAMASVANINDVIEGHVALEIECVDRLYLNAYVPALQVGGQVVRFMCGHLGRPIASAAVLAPIGNRFRREVRQFAAAHGIPILQLKKPDRSRWDDRKLDHVRPYLDRAEREGRYGVVAIVACQEFQWVLSARNRQRRPGARPNFEFFKEERRVGIYYFYILDPEFGPAFIKLCTYAPWPGKVWLSGHEWVKRQALRDGIGYTELENGFASSSDPARLQALCDSFGPDHVQGFFDRWIGQIPTPLSVEDRAAGYWWELSMRQVEVSRTLAFDAPRRARSFFEALVADNIGIGRPEETSLVFARRVTKRTRERFGTRIVSRGTDVRIDFRYKHSRVKQYLKGGRALRVETVINKPSDLGVAARLHHLPELIDRGRGVNQRLLMIERAGQSCAIGSALFERIHKPYNREGHRAGALRFGDLRAMALAGALCCVLPAVTGFTNKSLRGLVAGLLGQDYSATKMSYDLRRLRLHGLIQRLPRSNTYVLTGEGIRVAVFYTKLQNRLLRPLLDADKPPARIEIRRALNTLESAVNAYIHNARLAPAA